MQTSGRKKVLDRVFDVIKHVISSGTLPEIGGRARRMVRNEVGDSDPYLLVKEPSTCEALTLYPRRNELLAEADDSLESVVWLSIAGNIIDFGPLR